MTTLELQSLYATLGTVRAVAEHLGMSTGTICGHLRRNGVKVRHRGGDWTRMPRPGKIEGNRVANHAAADARIYRDRWWAHVQHDLCLSGCGRKALRIGQRVLSYCRRCGAAWALSQRARLGQAPRSRSVPGRSSVYLPQEMR